MKGKLKSELNEFARRRSNEYPYNDNLEVDCLVIGAGFGGVYMLHELRKRGFKTVIYEAGTGFGGTWRWNCYPGARVDSEVPIYQLNIPEVWKDWTWSTNYPDYAELRAYFDHADSVLKLSKDTAFETCVVGTDFDNKKGIWSVKTADGRKATAQHLIVSAGFAAKRYIPDFKGLETFTGEMYHSSFWPDKPVDVRGKRVAVIGTGASGVQIAQEWGPQIGDSGSMLVFQRTPNLAVPMGKKDLSREEQQKAKKHYPEVFKLREHCFGGFEFDFCERNAEDDTPQEREAFWSSLWNHGGFSYWLGNYSDYLYDEKANRMVYDFWVRRVRPRIGDANKRDLLAPLDPPHPWGVKRPCLEQNYFEQFNRSNVDIVNLKDNPITEFKPNGIVTADGKYYEVDIVAMATGFDITTGGMTSMGLTSMNGTQLSDDWKNGAYTYLGVTCPGYPNMYHLYGPHGPTLLSNGPTSIEIQGRWIVDVIRKMEREKIKFIVPTIEASKAWKSRINELSDISLFPRMQTSTYMGGSIPGKVREQVNYAGGEASYHKEIRAALPGLKGFEVVSY